MNRKVMSLGVLAIALLAVAGWSLLASPQDLRQEITLGHRYIIGGVKLEPGSYIVVHKSLKDRTGEECTFVYRSSASPNEGPVVKMRCTPTEGNVATEFKMEGTRAADGSSEVRSIQFAGTTEIHHLEKGS